MVVKVTVWPTGNGLPLASRTVALRVLVAVPLAVIEVGLAVRPVTVEVLASANSATVAVLVAAVAALAVTVAVPAAVPFKVTLATPLALVVAVLADRVPLVVVKVTVWPTGNGLPLASRTVALRVLVAVPLAVIEVGLVVRPVTAAVLASATSATVAVLVAAVAALAVTVAVPAVVPFKVMLATPLALVVAVLADRVPLVVVKVTVWPAGNRLPLASRTVALKVLVAVSFAVIKVGLAVKPVTVDVLASGVRSTAVSANPLTAVALIADVPATTPLRVTLALPCASVVLDAAESWPIDLDQVTRAPGTGLSFASTTIATNVLV
ncbi:hypothetical protein PS623_04770 [Pseudomonas fluorescens]|nr:hypothetical protein PS623_04770 [Pseudomonas fluorescens]